MVGSTGRSIAAAAMAAALVVGGCASDDAEPAAGTSAPPPGPPGEWTTFGYDLANSRFNPDEAVLTPDNVGELAPAWEIEGDQGVSGTPTVVDGTVYFGDWAGVVHAVAATDGTERWATPLEGGNVMSSVTVVDDALYVTTNQLLYRLDRSTGAIEWEATSSEHPLAISPGSPVVVDDIVLQGTASGELMIPTDAYSFRGSMAGFDAATGEERWRLWFTEDDETSGAGVGVWSTPSVDPERGLAFIGTGNTYEPPASPLSDAIVAFDYRTGEEAWTAQFTYPDVWSAGNSGGLDADVGAGPNLWTTTDGRDLVGAGDKQGTFHAVDRATGEVVWEADMTGGSVLGGVIGTSAYAEGTLYVGSNAGGEGNMPTGETEVLALDADTGEIRWSTTLPGAIYAPITVVPDLVLAATTEGQMVALDAGSGEQRWSFTAPDQVGSGPSVVDGTVYWGYGFALSLGSESAGLGGLMAFTPSGAPAGGTAPGGEAASGVGADVYRKSCASCHGTKGQGGIGPSLVGVADRLSEDEHLDTVRNGRDGTQMQGFEGTLTDDEIAAVVAHERTALTGS